MSVVIWHNPRCSKSRDALALIEARGVAPRIVDYLQTPPTPREIKTAAALMGVPVRALVRTKEADYARLGLADPALSDDALAETLSKHPVLIERPVIFSRGRAAIGRPPEAVLGIL